MKCPNFFILGAEKCGTTSLYTFLNQHPNVCFSVPKEPIFFEAEYVRGLEYYWGRYFNSWKGEYAIGEARHRNLYLPYIPKRIFESIPNPKFIVIVRNPIKRAYSHWLNRYAAGYEMLSFEDALYEDKRRIDEGIIFAGEEGAHLWSQSLVLDPSKKGIAASKQYRTYLDSGYYSEQIRRYLELFPNDCIKVVFLRDLSQNPQLVVSELWSFLGVDPNVQLVDFRPKNISQNLIQVRFKRYKSRFKIISHLPRRIKRLGLYLLENLWASAEPISPSTKEFLVNHYYKYNRDLEKITGTDLSYWDQ